MTTENPEGARRLKATDLSAQKKAQLRASLQHDLTEAMIRAVKANPPEVDLSGVEIVLGAGKSLDDFDVVKDCNTCGTCQTCTTCETCATCTTCGTGAGEESGEEGRLRRALERAGITL